jgi:hypothetical protein
MLSKALLVVHVDHLKPYIIEETESGEPWQTPELELDEPDQTLDVNHSYSTYRESLPQTTRHGRLVNFLLNSFVCLQIDIIISLSPSS